jgi:type IV pilus assembly protein PilC
VSINRRKTHGFLTAADKSEALEQLLNGGLTALSLVPVQNEGEEQSIWEKDLFQTDIHKVKIPKKLLLNMLNQMALMMKAGVSLIMAMDVMIDGEKDKNFRKILQEMRQDLLGGMQLSDSMAKFRAFPEMFISIVRAGEENGRLDEAFDRCAALQESAMSITAKLRSALIYPGILFALTIALIIVMNVLVLPSFEGIFEQFDAPLPALTVGVMAVSKFIMTRWYVIVAVMIAVFAAYKAGRRFSPSFVLRTDTLKLRFPIVGEVLRLSLLARFSRVMSSLVNAGVNVVHSLEISAKVVQNRLIQDSIMGMIEDVKVGVAIHSSMKRFSVFDSLMVSMVKAGEETGLLGDSLGKVAGLYESRSNESTKRMTALLEPIMTIIIAVIVGTVIISIVMPMFGMYSVVSQN